MSPEPEPQPEWPEPSPDPNTNRPTRPKATASPTMPLNRVAIPTTTYSSRGGATVTTIVCHTAEGAANFRDLGAFFQNSANTSNPTSSHVGIDDTPNTVGEYVPRTGKAWTAGNANPWSVQAELCAFAEWTPDEWAAHEVMLQNTAAWIAEEAAYFNIPLVVLSDDQAQDPSQRGVCQHANLGQMGGGHWDCGPNFPIDQVLAMAAGSSPATPLAPEWEEPDVYLIQAKSGWISMFDGSKKTGIVDQDSANAFITAGVKLIKVSDDQYNKIPNA